MCLSELALVASGGQIVAALERRVNPIGPALEDNGQPIQGSRLAKAP